MNQYPLRNPIRLLLFTSDNCKWCPAVISSISKILNEQMHKQISMTLIDIEISPELATDYKVNLLPALYTGTRLILSGYLSEDEIRDKIQTELLQLVMTTRQAEAKNKENIVWLTLNMLESLTQKRKIRHAIADYAHIKSLQLCNVALLALDPLASYSLYNIGKMGGILGPLQSLIRQHVPTLQTISNATTRFQTSLQALTRLMSDPTVYAGYIIYKAQIKSLDAQTATVHVLESAFASSIINVGERLCYYLSGLFAGVLQNLTEESFKVTETTCLGQGYDVCEFQIEHQLAAPEIIPIIRDKTKEDYRTRRNSYLYFIMANSQTMLDAIAQKQPIRPHIGDFIHISIIQQVFSTLKTMDVFSGLLLQSAGLYYGLLGSNKHILQKILLDNHLQTPLSLENALSVLKNELLHKLNRQCQEYDQVFFWL